MDLKKKTTIITVSLVIIGAIAGYVYWQTIGCNSGTCAITSKWHWTTLYGAFFGYVIGDTIKGYLKKRQNKISDQKD
jgi:hypothetical protein